MWNVRQIKKRANKKYCQQGRNIANRVGKFNFKKTVSVMFNKAAMIIEKKWKKYWLVVKEIDQNNAKIKESGSLIAICNTNYTRIRFLNIIKLIFFHCQFCFFVLWA